jgi:hypothetical protein
MPNRKQLPNGRHRRLKSAAQLVIVSIYWSDSVEFVVSLALGLHDSA